MFGIFDADNIFDVVRPIHRYSRTFGLTAFGIDENKEKEWKAKSSVWSILHVFLLSIYFIIMIAYFLQNFDQLLMLEKIVLSETIKISTILTTVVYCFASLAIAFVTLLTKNAIVNAINIVADVDKELFQIGHRMNHTRHKSFIIYIIIAWSFVTLCAIVFSYWASLKFINFTINPLLYFSMVINVNFIFAFNFQSILIVWCLKLRFREINRFLCTSFTSTEFKHFESVNKKLNLNKAARLHELIILASECVSDGFGVAVSFSHII
jgi:7tm Chemosensory receptor